MLYPTNISPMIFRFSIVLLIYLLSTFGLKAQKTIIYQNLYWLRYYNLMKINERFTWHNEAEIRRFWDGDVLHHFIVHSRMHYKINDNTNIGVGLTYSRQSPQEPVSESKLVVPEFRGVQEINYTIPFSDRFSLQQRLRVDERFIRRNDGIKLLDGYNFNFRFRIRLQANYRINREPTVKRTIIKLANEVLFNAGKNIVYNYFDQNRIYIGVEQGLSRRFSVELGYMKWFQQTAAGDVFFNRNIIRITLYHNIAI